VRQEKDEHLEADLRIYKSLIKMNDLAWGSKELIHTGFGLGIPAKYENRPSKKLRDKPGFMKIPYELRFFIFRYYFLLESNIKYPCRAVIRDKYNEEKSR
jgi:hypothetical protein